MYQNQSKPPPREINEYQRSWEDSKKVSCAGINCMYVVIKTESMIDVHVQIYHRRNIVMVFCLLNT